MKFKKTAQLVFIFTAVYTANGFAQGVRYITDELRINLRAGPGTEYKILQTLKSRNKVSLLEDKEGWSRVEYRDQTGWVPSQYLIFTSTALIDSAQMDVDLKDKVDFQNSQGIIQIQQQAIERLGNENKSLLIQKNKLEQQLDSLQDLNNVAEKMQREREKLLSRVVEAENRYQLLENVYASSTDETTKKRVLLSLISASVAFVLGIASSYLKKRKRRY